MKIQSIKAHAIAVPLKYVYAVATEPFTVATQIIVEVMTDDGLTGLGTIHGRAAKPVLEAVDKNLSVNNIFLARHLPKANDCGGEHVQSQV